ncbi:MAG: hypothetical protein ACI9VR_000977 [Cognaticolwellia sp.]|jgi:hypothetical protein
MQAELPASIAIIGVNEVGKEGSNETFTEGRDLPWLQDTEEQAVWSQWGVSYRDVVLVDPQGAVVGVFNLTVHDLGQNSDYDALKDALLSIDSGE